MANRSLAAPRLGGATKAGGREYRVQNPQLFAAVIDDAITRRHEGIRDQAARSVGLRHNTLKRYQTGAGAKVRHETLEKLRRLVGRGRVKSLESALFSPDARDALAEYDRWVAREIRALLLGNALNLRRVSARTEWERENHLAAGLERASVLEKLLIRLKKQYPAEWKPLTTFLVRRGHFTARAKLAQLRIVAPLLGDYDTGGIERGESELSETELQQFIKAGIKRERILLDRESDIRRAQEHVSQMDWQSLEKGWR